MFQVLSITDTLQDCPSVLNNNTSGHKEFLKSLNWQVIKLNNNTHNSNLYPKASIFYKKMLFLFFSTKRNIMMTFKQERMEVKALLLPHEKKCAWTHQDLGQKIKQIATYNRTWQRFRSKEDGRIFSSSVGSSVYWPIYPLLFDPETACSYLQLK